MALNQEIRISRFATAVIIFLGIISIALYCGIFAIAVEAPTEEKLRDERDTHTRIVQALDAQIGLMKWMGGTIVGSLVTAVGILWKSNLAKDATILSEVKGAGSLREQFLQELQAARDMRVNVIASVDGLVRKIEYCPGRREREVAASTNIK